MPIRFRQMKRKGSFRGPPGKRRRVTLQTRRTTTVSRGFRSYRRSRRGKGGCRPMILKVPVPNRLMTKLIYVDYLDTSYNTTGLTSHYFRASVQDPNETGTGHQPLWHDQISPNYKHYKVHGIKYDIRIVNLAGTAATVFVTHTGHDQGTGGLDDKTEMERRSARSFRLIAPAGSGNNAARIRGYLNCARTEAMGKAEYNANDNYEGTVGFNPIKFSRLGIHGIARIAGVATCYVQVSLIYYVEFMDRVMVSGS